MRSDSNTGRRLVVAPLIVATSLAAIVRLSVIVALSLLIIAIILVAIVLIAISLLVIAISLLIVASALIAPILVVVLAALLLRSIVTFSFRAHRHGSLDLTVSLRARIYIGRYLRTEICRKSVVGGEQYVLILLEPHLFGRDNRQIY